MEYIRSLIRVYCDTGGFIKQHPLPLSISPLRRRRMIRKRLLWFTSGFILTGASIATIIHRDLSSDRHLLLAQLKDNFGALDTRVSNLESLPQIPNVQQSTAQPTSQDGSSSS